MLEGTFSGQFVTVFEREFEVDRTSPHVAQGKIRVTLLPLDHALLNDIYNSKSARWLHGCVARMTLVMHTVTFKHPSSHALYVRPGRVHELNTIYIVSNGRPKYGWQFEISCPRILRMTISAFPRGRRCINVVASEMTVQKW
jgi:hypothetical protein